MSVIRLTSQQLTMPYVLVADAALLLKSSTAFRNSSVAVKEYPQPPQHLLNDLLLVHDAFFSPANSNGGSNSIVAKIIEILQAFLCIILFFDMYCKVMVDCLIYVLSCNYEKFCSSYLR